MRKLPEMRIPIGAQLMMVHLIFIETPNNERLNPPISQHTHHLSTTLLFRGICGVLSQMPSICYGADYRPLSER